MNEAFSRLRCVLPALLVLAVVIAGSVAGQTGEGRAVPQAALPKPVARKLGQLDFEKDLKDPYGYLTPGFSPVWSRGKSRRGNPVVTYVKGHTGLAVRSSHNTADDGGGDLCVRVGSLKEPWPKTNELYLRFWVKYEKNYRKADTHRIWNVKWLWTLGSAHNEIIFQHYDDARGRLGVAWQLNKGGTGWSGGKRVTVNGGIPYRFGDWLKVEIYFKLSSGEKHLNPDGVQWLKLNGVKVIEGKNVVTGRPGRMSSPAIKATADCPTGRGWWQLDDYEAWDGLPPQEETGKPRPGTPAPREKTSPKSRRK